MAKKRLKLKPRFYVILLVLLVFIIFLIIPKSYEKKYNINNYEVIEKFDKKNNRYNLSLSKDDKIFDYNFTSKYIGKKIIKNIEEKEQDNTYCIILNFKEDKVPLCIKDNEHIDYTLVDNIDLKEYNLDIESNYNTIDNINTYNLLDNGYFIWNYHEFIYIDNNGKKSIDLFKNDYYNINLATTINNYLVIPNYDAGYNFKELYLINLDTLKKETWNLNYEISFESYILGTYDNSIYIVDKKNELEYKLDIKRKEMKIVGTKERNATILNNGNFEEISMYKLANNVLSFTYDKDQYFQIENNRLYLNTKNNKILLSYMANKIIYQDSDCVYFLVGDSLHYYDSKIKEIKVMQSFEWNFNNNNIIFINTNKK